MKTPKPDVVVIGAGAAGIFAALRAAELGSKVLLLEKTQRIGTKILISGGGKCNIAHDGPIEEILKAFRPNEARFIRPSVYKLPNTEIMRRFTSRGLRIYTRPDGRVFPIDQTAKDVVAILKDYLVEAGVDIRMNTPVERIVAENGRVVAVETGAPFEKNQGYRTQAPRQQFGAKALLAEAKNIVDADGESGLNNMRIACDRVVLCAGGSSYPNSGTTGDGWSWARDLGHTVEWVHAALAPIYLELDPFDPKRSGVALRNVVLRARQGGKELARWRNDLLFTHQGVSGPTVLGVSRIVAEHMSDVPINLLVDLLPDISAEDLGSELTQLATESPKKLVATWVTGALPESQAEDFLNQTNVPKDLPLGRLDKKSRNRLVENLKHWNLGTVRHVPLEKGEVVAGGISLDEVDPKTLKSRKIEGLLLAGEVLDIAGPVGGYNLQAAFATGFVAGESANSNIW